MKKFIFCCLVCLVAACSVMKAQSTSTVKEEIPSISEDALVDFDNNVVLVHSAENAYAFDKLGEHEYRLLSYVSFPRTSEEKTYITKMVVGDTILYRVHFKCHGRWFQKELGHAVQKNKHLEWVSE